MPATPIHPPEPHEFRCHDCYNYVVEIPITVDTNEYCRSCIRTAGDRISTCGMCANLSFNHYHASRDRTICRACALICSHESNGTRSCHNCSTFMDEGESVQADGRHYCPRCIERHGRTCAVCDNRMIRGRQATNRRMICSDCAASRAQCHGCDHLMDEGESNECEGMPFCSECYATRTHVCLSCDTRCTRTYTATRGRRVCRSCQSGSRGTSPRMIICDRCRVYMDADEVTRIQRYNVCPACTSDARNCDGCGERSMELRDTLDSNDEICIVCLDNEYACCGYCGRYGDPSVTAFTEVQSGSEVCSGCLDNEYRHCGGCDEYYMYSSYCTNCDDDDDDDYSSSSSRRDHVHYYSYKPDPEFHSVAEETTKVFLGLELEVARTNSRCASAACDALGSLGYLKEDGSVSSGFEMVTHPMTHAYARESFPWALLEELSNEGARADSSAGIHVHVSRDGFAGQAHQYSWLKFIYRNENGVTGIARRRGSSWARFGDEQRSGVKDHVKSLRACRNAERYSAVNVQNDHTFEVRVFKSSLVKQEVQAALDLVAASVEYTRKLSVPAIIAGGWDWNAFRTWVSERPEYTALSEEMAKCAS